MGDNNLKLKFSLATTVSSKHSLFYYKSLNKIIGAGLCYIVIGNGKLPLLKWKFFMDFNKITISFELFSILVVVTSYTQVGRQNYTQFNLNIIVFFFSKPINPKCSSKCCENECCIPTTVDVI